MSRSSRFPGGVIRRLGPSIGQSSEFKDHHSNMIFSPPSARAGWWSLGVLALLAGCQESETISRYQAPKPVVVEAPRTRTVGAIVPRGDQAWFFKLTGLAVQLEGARQTFDEFLETVEFDSAGNPQWPLPEGWRERPGDAIRYRTLLMSTDVNPLEISVTRLPLPETELDEYLLSNVNRWRDQLSLGPLEKDQLSQDMVTIRLGGELVAYVVDFEGRGMGRMGGAPPFAASGSSAGDSRERPGDSGPGPGESPQAEELDYEVPVGWRDTGSGGFRHASFRMGAGENGAEVTVIALGPNSGSVLENINRWRGQVNLPPWQAEQLDEETQSLAAQNAEGTYVVLHGPEDAGRRESILGVILPREDRVWFVKMTGSTEVVQREQAQFESFTQSLRLP
jgi:hypothetical protein